MLRAAFVLVFAVAAAAPVRADHDNAKSILGAWNSLLPNLYVLKPPTDVRPLPPSTNKAAIDRVAPDAQALLRNTMAVVLVENGEVLFEGYANGATKDTPMRAYSVAKSLTALAVGEALCAGKVKSLDDKAAVYAPALEGTAYGASSVRNLLKYTSGAEDPGGNGYAGIHSFRDFNAMIAHKQSLLDLMKKYGKPGRFGQGEKFVYNGLDSQALGFVVRGATGMPLQNWFEETVWKKAGTESPAGWWMDRDGNGNAEYMMLMTVRDFSRIGLYVLDRLTGKAGDPCVGEFLRTASSSLTVKGYWDAAPSFGMGIHVGADGNPWMFGHGGQRIGINARSNRVFATNGYADGRSLDVNVQALLAR